MATSSDIPLLLGVGLQTVKTATPAIHGTTNIQKVDALGVVSVDENGVTSPIGGGGGSGTDVFAAMAGRARAYSTRLRHVFVEDFGILAATSNVDIITGGTSGATAGAGKGGIARLVSDTANTNFTIVTPKGGTPFIGDWLAEDWYIEFLVTGFSGAVAAAAGHWHGVGICRAGAPFDPATMAFAIFGQIGPGTPDPTKYGISAFDGAAQSFPTGTIAVDGTTEHFLTMAHTASSHLIQCYVDNVLGLTASDTILGVARPGTYKIEEHGATAGVLQVDAVLMASE